MSKISDGKKEKIKEEILRVLYEIYPEFKYTYQISDLILRDDEFTLNLLKTIPIKKASTQEIIIPKTSAKKKFTPKNVIKIATAYAPIPKKAA